MADKEIYLLPTNYAPSGGWAHKHPSPDARTIHWKGDLQAKATKGHKYNGIGYLSYYGDNTDKPIAEFMNTVDYSKKEYYDGKWTYGRGVSFNKDDAFMDHNDGAIDAPTREKGFRLTVYDNKHHYCALNFCNVLGLIDDKSAYLNQGTTNSYLSGVVGFHFKWSWKNAHSSSHCAFPRRAALLYARETEDGSGSAKSRIMAIEPSSKIGGASLGDSVTEVPGNDETYNYNYKLSNSQFQLYKDRLDLSVQEHKEKWRFIGIAIEFSCTDKSSSKMTMTGWVWDFKPIVAPEYNLGTSTSTKGRRYAVLPPPDEHRWQMANNNYDPIIMK
jgi:hypothetical protein